MFLTPNCCHLHQALKRAINRNTVLVSLERSLSDASQSLSDLISLDLKPFQNNYFHYLYDPFYSWLSDLPICWLLYSFIVRFSFILGRVIDQFFSSTPVWLNDCSNILVNWFDHLDLTFKFQIVGSCPQYPHGIIDPIEEMSKVTFHHLCETLRIIHRIFSNICCRRIEAAFCDEKL